jgi:hypothetical protein
VDDLDYHLLTWLEGQSVFRPAEPTDASRVAFQATALRLFALRDRGLIHFLDSHTSRSESGDYLLIGPCTLSAEGRAALIRDRQLGPRNPTMK